MKRLTHREIVSYSTNRAIVETQLCTEMYRLYDRPALLHPIRMVVSLAIEQILGMMQFKSLQGKVSWDGAIKKAGANLAVWRLAGSKPRETAAGLMQVWENEAQWTADDCGDLIRLFGGLIEDKSLHGQAVDSSVNDDREAKRAYGFGSDERSRSTAGFNESIAHIGQAHKAVLSAKRVQGGFSGIEKISLTEKSTVKKIDSAYGLAEGCDISGTTADSIFFFDHVNTFIKGLPEAIPSDVLPAIQLFPMATMGSQGHHTVLECALTLTQNKIIDYRVGFYTTLMPSGVKNPSLQSLFSRYENDSRNAHMLCWWDDTYSKLSGVKFESPHELQLLKQSSLADPSLLRDFKMLRPRASRRELLGLTRYRELGRIFGLA